MSYLLGYQKWRKLHESAKYGKLYEQAFDKSPAQFVIIGGTDPTPINDATLHTETGIPDGKGIALYEISVKDAVSNNFVVAKKIKDLNTANINERDQFKIVDAGGQVINGLEIAGEKKSITFTYTPKSTYKIHFSGNGVLAMHRAVLELGDLIEAVKNLDLNSHSGHIRLYMNHKTNPIPLSSAKSGRLGLGATSLGAMPAASQVASDLQTYCIAPAIHYLLSDEHKEGFKKSYPKSFSPILIDSTTSKNLFYDGQVLKDNAYALLTSDGAFMKSGNPYTALDSLKGQTPESLLKGVGSSYSDTTPLPKKDEKGKRDITLKDKIRSAINEYLKTCLNNYIAEGGTVDTYFKLKLKGADDDLIKTLSAPIKAHYNRVISTFDSIPIKYAAFAVLYIDKQSGLSGDVTQRGPVNVPKGETEYESGKSGSGGTKTSAPTPQVGPKTPVNQPPPAPERK